MGKNGSAKFYGRGYIFLASYNKNRKKDKLKFYTQIIISHWINGLCDLHCREETPANYIVVAILKIACTPLPFIIFLSLNCFVCVKFNKISFCVSTLIVFMCANLCR